MRVNNVDSVEITVVAGRGGDGAAHFLRGKFMPFGGPDGGDGGKGGDVYIEADTSINNLTLFRRMRVFKAGSGKPGGKQKMHGRNGEDVHIKVPVGTVLSVVDNDVTEGVIADLKVQGQRALVARGGKGGGGNVQFTTSTNQAPTTASKGMQGELRKILIDLKMIADIGIIGYPSVGKSTLLSVISGAKPDIAAYPFTTKEPVLGVVVPERGEIYTVAEIPGLIEGAHAGKGLGHAFLRHAERTKGLVFLLDGTSPDIFSDYQKLNHELILYKSVFALKPRFIAVSKIDLPEVSERMMDIVASLSGHTEKVIFVSSITGKGLPDLMIAMAELVEASRKKQEVEEEPPVVFRPRPIRKRQ